MSIATTGAASRPRTSDCDTAGSGRAAVAVLRWLLLPAAILLTGSTATPGPRTSSLVDVVKERNPSSVRAALGKRALDVNETDGEGATALHWAVHQDSLETVDLLLATGARPNIATEYGVTPLMLASKNGHTAMVSKLLEAGAHANVPLSTGETPLMWAARTGSLEAVRALLAHGANPNATEDVRGQTALMWAAVRDHSTVVQLLLQGGADVNARSSRGFTALLFAVRHGSIAAAQALRAAGADVNDALPDRTNALLLAVTNGQVPTAAWLLDQGATPNVSDNAGMTPLHAAFLRQTPDPTLVRLLLDRGANPNARLTAGPVSLPSEIGGYVFLAGATPFAMAALAGDAPMMRVLAAAGADPSIETTNRTNALMIAAGVGRFGVEGPPPEEELLRRRAAVEAALDLGLDLNAANSTGQSALHGAANNGANPVIELLVARGAAIHARDRNGLTALDLAERALRNGGPQLTVDLLRKLGG